MKPKAPVYARLQPTDYLMTDQIDPDDLPPNVEFGYEKPGYECIWNQDWLEDKFCRITRESFTDKERGNTFPIGELTDARLIWVDIPGTLFRSRRAGYQIVAKFRAEPVVLLDGVDTIKNHRDPVEVQILCSGQKNVLKVALASLFLAQNGGDIRISNLQVFDEFGSDIFDSFQWPIGALPDTW